MQKKKNNPMKTFTKYKLCCQSRLQRTKMKFINF